MSADTRDTAIIGLALDIFEEQADGFEKIRDGLTAYLEKARALKFAPEVLAKHESAQREAIRIRNTAAVIVGYLRGYAAASHDAMVTIGESKALTEAGGK